MRLILNTHSTVRGIVKFTADKHGQVATFLQISRSKNEQIQEFVVTLTLNVLIFGQLDYSSYSQAGIHYLFMCGQLTILNGYMLSFISSTEFDFFQVLWDILFKVDGCISRRKLSLTAFFRSVIVRKRSCEMLHFTIIPQSELSLFVKSGLRGGHTCISCMIHD